MRRQALQKTITKHQNRLDELESEKQSLEQVLERTSHLFRQTVLERHQMTATWTTAVQTLNARNHTIRDVLEVNYFESFQTIQQNFKNYNSRLIICLILFFLQKVTQSRVFGERKTIELKEQNEFLEQQIENNKESEFMIGEMNQQISKVRALLTRHSEEIQLKANELITLRRQIQNDANCLQQMRQKNHKVTIEHETKTKDIAKLNGIVDDLVSKMGKIQNEKDNAEHRLRHLEELFQDEEKSIHDIELEIAKLSQMIYRSSQMIQQQHNEQKFFEVGK